MHQKRLAVSLGSLYSAPQTPQLDLREGRRGNDRKGGDRGKGRDQKKGGQREEKKEKGRGNLAPMVNFFSALEVIF